MKAEKDFNTKLYNAKFYKNQKQGSCQTARCILPFVFEILPKVNSVVDFGCGYGGWLSVLNEEFGISEIKGYDGPWVNPDKLLIPKENFTPAMLNKKITLEKRYDLAMTIEAAEHLPEASADIFVETLTSASDFVLFSAAIPKQGGANHINEQWQSYWFEKFEKRGYVGIDCLRSKIWNNGEIGRIYKQNLMLYVKKTEWKISMSPPPHSAMLDIVHPEVYMEKMEDPSLKQSIKKIPNKILRRIKRLI